MSVITASSSAEPRPYDWAEDRLASSEITPDCTWEGFAQRLADWPTGDALKITLLHVVTMAAGHTGRQVDIDALAARLERAPATVRQWCNRLADIGWLEPVGSLTSAGYPTKEYRTARWIDG